ncbi:uncharacterized protein LOC111642833 [Copidosoma floridanum]|uniref:uncharacterized protein LOC111642833 n=1 Tax=Copidosoma floridanum TaxID=29053 RepID=UPI000C6F9799|nr:uncharacterized protein LOC111642833 [Copidosoma floridanum]
MASKVLFCAFLTAYVYFVAADNSDTPKDVSPMFPYVMVNKGQKCVPEKSYHDGCNTNVCAGNRQNADGTWIPVIYSSQILCMNENNQIKAMKAPPADFWQNTIYAIDDNMQKVADNNVEIFNLP